MADAPQICPSCAGQLSSGSESCPWCGAKLGPDVEKTSVAPPKPPPTRPDVGFGEGANRGLPENMPPPPRTLPFEKLNSGQIMLRAIIVVMALYILVVFGHRALQNATNAACASPVGVGPLCQNASGGAP